MAYDETWDVLVIGAGLNGMTLANYLLKSGLRVMVLERRLESGGGLASEEPTITGFWHNTGHYVFDTLNLLPFHKELGLQEVNISFVHPDVQSALPLGDGRALVVYKDLKRTLESVAAFSRKDAQAWQRLHRAGASGIPEFSGRALRAPARRKVPAGSMVLTTARPYIRRPPINSTPTARPFSTRIRVTSVMSQISPPRFRMAVHIPWAISCDPSCTNCPCPAWATARATKCPVPE
jgi:phytoene dehydrogenase-like protein